MSDKQKYGRPVRVRSWILPFVLYLSLLFIMLLIDGASWTINFREGTFFERNILHSSFFMDWFTPYSKPELNVLTVFFTIMLLPEATIKAIEHIKSKRQTSS